MTQKTGRKIIGGLLMASPFAVMYCFMGAEYGWWSVTLVFAGTILASAAIGIGGAMLFPEEGS